MPRKEWDKDLAQKMYDEGASDRVIAEKVGVVIPTISRWRKSQGLPPNVLSRARVDHDALRDMYDSGMTDAEIAKELRISVGGVGNWRRDQNLPPNKKWDQKEALLLYNEGYSDKEIAAKVGVSSKRIWAWRQRNGFEDQPISNHVEEEKTEEEDVLTDVPLGDSLEAASVASDLLDEEDEEDESPSDSEHLTVLEAALEVFWAQGYTISELAYDLGLPLGHVTQWVRLTHPEEINRLDFDTVEALDLLRAGKHDREIAAILRVPPRAITNWRRRHDYVVDAPASFDEEKATQMFHSGMFDRDIARELGGDVTKADIQAWRARNNLNLYDEKGRPQDNRPRNDRTTGRRISTGNSKTYDSRPRYDNRTPYSGNSRTNSGNRQQNARYSGNTYQRESTTSSTNGNGTRRSPSRTENENISRQRPATRNWDPNAARHMWEAGMNDFEIARQLGTTASAIRSWRQQNNLK